MRPPVPVEQMSIYPLNGKPPVRGKRTGGSIAMESESTMHNMQTHMQHINHNMLTNDQISQVSCEVKVVTPKFAASKLEEWHYPLQRSLIKGNVERLTEEMRRHRFVVGTPVTVCQTPDGKRYLVNARHTLSAVVESDIPIPLTIITLQVADLNAVGRVYATFDIHRTRSYAASWKAFKGSDGTELENRALAALPIVYNGFDPVNVSTSREERFEWLQHYIREGTIELVGNALDPTGAAISTKAHGAKIKRAGILAVVLYTAYHQPSEAFTFWRQVLLEDHPDSNHPSRALVRYLAAGRAGAGTRYQVEDLKYAAQAWNGFWERRTAAYLKPGAMKVFHLVGTPWAKGNPDK